MKIKDTFEIIGEVLGAVGEHQDSMKMAVLYTMLSRTGLYETSAMDFKMNSLYGFALLTVDNVNRLKKDFLTPHKETTKQFTELSGVDLWKSKTKTIEFNLRGNIVFQTLIIYYILRDAGIKRLEPNTESIRDAVERLVPKNNYETDETARDIFEQEFDEFFLDRNFEG